MKSKIHVLMRGLLIFPLFLLSISSHAESVVLYQYDGNTHKVADLPYKLKHSLYEIALASFKKKKQLVDNAIFQSHVDKIVKKDGLSETDTIRKLLNIAEPTAQQLKQFYDANKDRIPYPLEKVKTQIIQIVFAQQMQTEKQRFISDLKQNKSFELLLMPPIAPVATISIDGLPTKGAKDAVVTIVKFADYQCPHCARAAYILDRLVEQYEDKVKLVYMDFPINPSGISRVIAYGAACAEEQGKFWDYNFMAFEAQSVLKKESVFTFAKDLKLNEETFKTCMDSTRPKTRVGASVSEGERLGINSTPALYINGIKADTHDMKKDLENIVKKALEDAANKQKSGS